MDSTFFRKYMDIINEAQTSDRLVITEAMISEGMLSNLAQKLASKFTAAMGDDIAQIANKVKAATGGNYALTADNIKAVANAFGLDAQDAKAEASGKEAMAETWGLAGNWQGKALQGLHSLGMLHLLMNFMGKGVFDTQLANNWVACACFILLLVTDTFWSTNKGMVGAMGKHGNQGFETDKGPVDKGY